MQYNDFWIIRTVDIDHAFDKMISEDFTGESIHNYREAIRKFRALLFFYMPLIAVNHYRYLEVHSKRYFDKTSLIRELDVFLKGYGSLMTTESKDQIERAQSPIISRLKLDARRMKSFRFSKINFKLSEDLEDGFIEQRLKDLYKMLAQTPLEEGVQLEKHIHMRRMLAKKIDYVLGDLFFGQEDLTPVKRHLNDFQLEAKKLHDVCVNLRLVGHYKLNDRILIEKLIEDHDLFLESAQDQFDKILSFIEKI